jgi:hypothetical protein
MNLYEYKEYCRESEIFKKYNNLHVLPERHATQARAFFGCSQLSIIIVDQWITNIDETAFANCKN